MLPDIEKKRKRNLNRQASFQLQKYIHANLLGTKPLGTGNCIGRITGKDDCVIGMLGIVNGCCSPVITGGAIYNCSACGAVLPAARDGLRLLC